MVRKSRPTEDEELPVGVEAVNRSLAVLRCFTDVAPVLSLTRIAELTGFYKSSVLRLAASLEAGGMLVRREDKSYALGHETLRLASVFRRSFRLEEYVRPVLRELLIATGESASFFRREGDGRLCLFREESRHSVREVIHEGDILSLSRGAAGHVLRHYANGATSPLGVLPIASRGERDADTGALAVPVFGSGRMLLGALSLSGPLSRFGEERMTTMAAQLRQAGRSLSEELGGGSAWD
jgi:DNA-binding IclR family transcriptional regulator